MGVKMAIYNGRYSEDSFQKHNERMRAFHKSHDRASEVRALLLGSMDTLQVTRTIMDTEELQGSTDTKERFALIPLLKVPLSRYSPN